MPTYHQLLRCLTLGTARATPPADLDAWLDPRQATDPTAETAERTLAAFALLERTHRLRARELPAGSVPPANAADAEVGRTCAPNPTLTAKLIALLALIFTDPYTGLLPEATHLLARHDLRFPHHLLPQVLERARILQRTDPAFARLLFDVSGPRGHWLATQNPAWRSLTDAVDFAAEFQRDRTPGGRTEILRRWRAYAPEAARAGLQAVWSDFKPKVQEQLLAPLAVGLSAADIPWLRGALLPKRRGVRRALLRLLVRAGDTESLNDLTEAAANSLTDRGWFGNLLPDAATKKTLDRYGGLDKRESPAVFFLTHLPPTTISDFLGLEPAEFWAGLTKAELAAAARAILDHGREDVSVAFVRYAAVAQPERLPRGLARQISASLGEAAFTDLFDGLLSTERDLFRAGTLAGDLALAHPRPWGARLTKAFYSTLFAGVHAGRQVPYAAQRALADRWRSAIPLLDVSLFGWLRTHLHAVTERPDVFGKLATETLQTTIFRKTLLAEVSVAQRVSQ